MEGVSVGRKEIMAYMGLTWMTVRKWDKVYGLPLRHYPDGKPFLIHSEHGRWAIKFDENRHKIK